MLSSLRCQAVRAIRAPLQLVRPSVRSFTTSLTLRALPPSSNRSARPSTTVSSSAVAKRAAVDVDAEENENDEFDDEEEFDEDEDEDGYDYDGEDASPSVAMVTKPAPYWEATALMPAKAPGAQPEFQKLSLDDFAGKWTVLFFYPLDFTFVCPTEIRAFSDRYAEFEKLGVSVVAASVDSEFSHLAWTQQPKENGGLGPMKIPILSDITKNISRNYGVLLEEQGVALRGLFIIDPKGVLRQSTVNDLPIGRSVDETLRLVQAFQFHEKNGDVCPAGWTPGKESMTADPAGLKKYFARK